MLGYKRYEVKDFMCDESFLRWVLDGSIEDQNFWEQWLSENADRKEVVEEARFALLDIHKGYAEIDISNQEEEMQLDKIMEIIETKEGRERTIIPVFQTNWFRVAASVLIVLGMGWLSYVNFRPDNPGFLTSAVSGEEVSLIVRTNKSGKPLLVTLPDGSSVLLRKGSFISFPEKFDAEKREVSLYGEGFFEVTKDKSKPFYIYTNKLTTKVLGTSFTIRAYEKEKQIRIMVKTGRVVAYAGEQKSTDKPAVINEMILTPNQEGVFDKEKNTVARLSSQTPVTEVLPIQQQAFEFKNTPVSEVFKVLEESYSTTIVLDSTVLQQHKTLTASLSDKPFYKKIELICKAINANYEKSGNKIIVRMGENQ